uniref:Lipoprotein n=1 Tax=Candidatus Kentrum sp. UNK TaxID=2126344 RepID=A0A451AHM4_9GAMM|nr:MAG: hypothetical protein BECKUNK1418G_GA0071005_10656 [Candidatus Kentron sp. UNK]VFK71512.1 MAG: hypothetical protein BECKUNK1418H_GA0071006_10706 [Candidatus Kentron sp. UNK]
MNRLLLALLSVAALAGCTSQVSLTRPDPGDPKTYVGIPYPLQYSYYDVTLSWEVKECREEEIIIKPSAKIDGPKKKIDEKNRFIIDIEESSSPLKTSDLNITYDPLGGIASFNSTVEDKTKEVLTNVASIGVGLAKIAAIPAPGFAPMARTPACTKRVEDALKELQKNKDDVKKKTKLVDTLTSELQILVGGNVDQITEKRLNEAFKALEKAKEDLETAKKEQSETLKAITHKEPTFQWPPDSVTTISKVHKLPEEKLNKWVEDVENKAIGGTTGTTIYLSLRPLHERSYQTEIDPTLGIPIRQRAHIPVATG